MRTALDGLYRVSLWLAALCLVIIAAMVGVQLGARLADGALKLIGLPPYGLVILSLAEIAGNLLAAASFFALAGTLKAGAHIRVTIVLSMFRGWARRSMELWALTFACAFSAYMTWSIGKFAFASYRFHEVSPGIIPIPLAIPQAAMTFGLIVLTIALFDELTLVWRGEWPTRATADATALDKEG